MTRIPSSLNATERRLLAILFRREADLMLPPTVRELAASIGHNSPGCVEVALAGLRAKGMVAWESGRARTIRLTCRLVDASPSRLPGTLPESEIVAE